MRRVTQQESVASGNDIELRTTESPVDNPANNFHSAFPEGGRDAYLCLLGSALILFPSFGFQVAIGTVQDYINTHQLADYSVSEVGWITAIYGFLALFLGVQVGPLFDRFGPRVLLILGSAASFASYILLAECTEYWHFILCLSILGGVSAAVVTTIAIAVLSHWFNKRRGLASGVCMAGSSAGGAIIPLMLRAMYPKYGWTWSMRAIAFMALGCYAAGIGLIKGRPPTGTPARATIDFAAFRSLRLSFLALAVFCFEFIIGGCAALLPTYVRYAGLSSNVQFYSLTVMNSMSLLGRVLPGFAADHVGRFNILLCLLVVTLIIMAGVWLPISSPSDAALYTIIAIFGFGSGGWISLAPVCAGQLCRTEEYGRFYGTIYAVAAFGVLLTVPVGGAMLQETSPQTLIGFYSAVTLVGLISVVLSRWALLDWNWKWKVKV